MEKSLLNKIVTKNFCVSKAIQESLVTEFKLDPKKIIVCYDKPKSNFGRTNLEESLILFKELTRKCKEISFSDFFTHSEIDNEFVFRSDNQRPYIAICSTGWTVDVDMGMLFDALKELDRHENSPIIYFFITGKGPLRMNFLEHFQKIQCKRIKIFSLWLSYENYRRLLGIADLGISLHYSSSGVDIPMKIVDYLGSELVTLSIKYSSIFEIIEEGTNGFIFENSAELSHLLSEIFHYPFNENPILKQMKTNIRNFPIEKWETYWQSTIFDLLRDENRLGKKDE